MNPVIFGLPLPRCYGLKCFLLLHPLAIGRLTNRFIHILVVFIGLASGLKGQTEILNKAFLDDVRFSKINDGTFSHPNLKISDIQGTPYLNETFEAGEIITPKDSVFANIELRYNAFTDDLEFKQGENVFNIAYKAIVKKAEFGGDVFSCRSYEVDGNIRDGFFKILTEGKATLLAKYKILFLDRVEAQAFSDYQPARFDIVQVEYFMAVDRNPAKLISNKKGLVKMFGEKSNEMETYISKNKVSVKEGDSLIKIVMYYNSL